MGVQKNIAALKANTESITENLKKLILEEQQTRELALGTLNLLGVGCGGSGSEVAELIPPARLKFHDFRYVSIGDIHCLDVTSE